MSKPTGTPRNQTRIRLQTTAFILIMLSSLGFYVAVESNLPLATWLLFALVGTAMTIAACAD